MTTQPLHHSQTIVEEPNRHVVSLRVMPTFELLQWLRAHASEITMLQPNHIKHAVIQSLVKAIARQNQG